jgi:hypothetical protein
MAKLFSKNSETELKILQIKHGEELYSGWTVYLPRADRIASLDVAPLKEKYYH